MKVFYFHLFLEPSVSLVDVFLERFIFFNLLLLALLLNFLTAAAASFLAGAGSSEICL